MKRLTLFFLTILSNCCLIAQYNFNTTFESYEELSDPISVNNGESWGNSDAFPVFFNFNFQIGTQTFTAVNVMAGGGLAFPGMGNLQLRVYGHPDSGYLLEDRGQDESVSPINYEIVGNSGEQILKIQWRNAGFRDWCDSSVDNDYCNFQIWLYEANGKIEVHFGEYEADAGAYGQPDCNSGTNGTQFIFEYATCDNALSLTGNASLPSYDFRDHCIWQPGIHVSGTPASGVIYNLTPITTSVEQLDESLFDFFPNPAENLIQIRNNYSEEYTIHFKTILGESIKLIDSGSDVIYIDDLPSGIYLVDFILKEGTITKRLVKL